MEISEALQDFKKYASDVLADYFEQKPATSPVMDKRSADLFAFLKREITADELVVLLTALMPHLQPHFFDQLIHQYLPKGGDFPEFGGIKGTNTRYMLPTGDTALFLLTGGQAEKRINYVSLFGNGHWFANTKTLWLEEVKEGEPKWSGRLVVSEELVDKMISGIVAAPKFGPDFPARLVTTQQNWKDLVLPEGTTSHLQELYAWLQYNQVAMNDPVLKRKTKPGYRALFYGPSGTGKTLVATLLGQEFHKDVYRIDLSQVVSKYIGETEKNLERIFARAEHQDWILFFDEADALFGKRSSVQSAHDKYANQEVSYLLQRVEDFPGMVILASNFKSNIDQAFLRRFNSIIEFPQPGAAERLQLWQKAMPETFATAKEVDLKWLADKYELTGSSINQVVHQAVLQMHLQKETMITNDLLQQAISRELRKSDKLLQ